MDNIEEYIDNIKIKKTIFGGFDKEAVYASMQDMCSSYQTDIDRLIAEKGLLEAEYKKITCELEEANKEIYRVNYELEEANKEIYRLNYELEEEKKSQNEYIKRFNTLTQMIDAINISKEKIIENSKKEARENIAKAQERYEDMKREYLLQKKQKDFEFSQIAQRKQQFGTAMDKIRFGLVELFSKLDVLHKDKLEQPQADGEKPGSGKSQDMLIDLNNEMGRIIQKKTE